MSRVDSVGRTKTEYRGQSHAGKRKSEVCDNTQIVNSHNKRVFEVTDKGEIVADSHISDPGHVFRIYKIPNNHPALKRNLGYDLGQTGRR